MITNSHTDPIGRKDFWFICACLLASTLVYIFLHGIYRPENMDDAWFLSFAYNHVVNGVEYDSVFGTQPGAGGFGGVMLFGKTYSYVYGSILSVIGWSKSNAHMISLLCIVISAACWIVILLKLGFSQRLATYFGLTLLLVEPFFGAANQARPDALSFLLVSGAFLLFVFRRHALAGFLATVAIEIHPVGISSFLFMGSVVVARATRSNRSSLFSLRTTAWFAVGIGAGILYYLTLHYQHLPLLPLVLSQGNTGGSEVNNILFEYFFKTKYFRHVPELIAIMTSAGWFLYMRYDRENCFIPFFFIASLLFTLMIRRPNFMYTIYVYPAFLVLVLWLFERHGRLMLGTALLLLYLLPQYALVFAQNRRWNMTEYLNHIRALTPDDAVTIVGRPNVWFAFPHRTFYVTDYRGDFHCIAPETFILVEDDIFRRGTYPALSSVINNLYVTSVLGSFQSQGKTVTLKMLVRKDEGTANHPVIP